MSSLKTLGMQIQDITAYVPNYIVQALNSLCNHGFYLGLTRFGTIPRIIQHEPHCIDGLDDSIMQVHSKTFSFLQTAQLLGLAIEAGILDGDCRLAGEYFQ